MEGAKILELCEKGDKLLDEEVAKVYKGKKVPKGPCVYISFMAAVRLRSGPTDQSTSASLAGHA